MKHSRRLIGTLAFLVTGAVAPAAAAPDPVGYCRAVFAEAMPAKAVVLTLSPELACVDGPIAGGTEAPLLAWAALPAAGPKILAVRSAGGIAASALRIAEALQAANVSLQVIDLCASSCANYLYGGLPERHVTDGALVLFHGGFSDQSEAAIMEGLDAMLAEAEPLIADPVAERERIWGEVQGSRRRQDALLARAGASTAIVHAVDALDLDALPQALCSDPAKERDFIFFSAKQAEDLGIAPLTGRLAETPAAVKAAILLTARGAGTAACRAPDGFNAQPAESPATPR